MTDGPWIPKRGGARRTIHSVRSCAVLQREGTSYRPATEVEIDRYNECKHCNGEIDRTGEQDQRLSAKLEGMSVDEFDTAIAEAGLR